jgi:hypothetical protein
LAVASASKRDVEAVKCVLQVRASMRGRVGVRVGVRVRLRVGVRIRVKHLIYF